MPEIGDNEAAYLLSPRAVFEPELLRGDFGLAPDSLNRRLSAPFGLLLAPAQVVFGDPLAVALAGRVLGWSLFLFAVARLSRALAIPGWVMAVGVFHFAFFRQSVAAGEWLIGDTEPKVIAWGCLLLALAHGLRGEWLRAGLACGAATIFHVLVGGWGGLALAIAALVTNACPLQTLALRFVTPWLALSAPMLAVAASALGDPGADAAAPASGAALLVLLRNPHHLDPFSFLDARSVAFIALCMIGIGVAARSVWPRERGALVVAFACAALAFFLAGVVARGLGLFPLLQFYPFRLADSLLPLSFWLAYSGILASAVAPLPGARRRRRALAAALLLGVVLTWERSHSGWPDPFAFVAAWKTHRERNGDPWRDTTDWIAGHTRAEDVFVAPPWLMDFPLRTARPAVVHFKVTPGAGAMAEWHERMLLLNGRADFRSGGSSMLAQLRSSYPRLQVDVLAELRERYRARFYLNTQERPELAATLRFQNASYWLYDLERLTEAPRETPP